MRRIQLDLDEQLWNFLQAQALSTDTSISELVRQSLRKHYLAALEKRRLAMLAVVGIRKSEPDQPDGESQVRELRSGDGSSPLG